jgi:hypothetical protein
MVEKLIQCLDLDNGLTIQIYDQSKNVASERWLVLLVARIDIPVPNGPVMLKNGDTVQGTELQKALGENVQYEYSSERNFIHEKEKQTCFDEMQASFLENIKVYLAHSDFQRSFILKKYREHLAQKKLYDNGMPVR